MTKEFFKGDSIETESETQEESMESPTIEEKSPETAREKLMDMLEKIYDEVQEIVKKYNELSKEQKLELERGYPELSQSISHREFVEILEAAADEPSWIEFRKLFGRWGKFEDLFKKMVEGSEQQQEKAEK